MEENQGGQKEQSSFPVNMEMLIAGVMPNAKHLDNRFDILQVQIDGLKHGQIDMKERIGRLETNVDKRFEQVDKRFEQVDKRFDQVDRRFEQVIASIDKLGDKLEARDYKQRGFTMRMFTIAISLSMVGLLGTFAKSLGIF